MAETALENENGYLKDLQRIFHDTEAKLETARQQQISNRFFEKYDQLVYRHDWARREITRVKNVILELEREAAKPSLLARIFGGA